MRRSLLLILSAFALLASCITEDVPHNTPMGNFEALWKAMDQHYCFFDAKQKLYGVDWDEVHTRYRSRITPNMTNIQLFDTLGNMLATLRDGHVNLYASHDVARYWQWYENYPANYSDSLLRVYMGTDYAIAAGMHYKVIDGNIGYLRVSTFENSIGDGNLTEIFRRFALTDGIIVDVRSNQGGMITSAEKLASCFYTKRQIAGYMQHKTGTRHNDFSKPEAIYIDRMKGIYWRKPVVVLTNRSTFSAGNNFVMYVKDLPNVTLVGDRTGGGAGMPFQSELPNGWSVRFSACPIYDAGMQLTEDGIEPDVRVDITSADYQRSRDTIIERAIDIILSSK